MNLHRLLQTAIDAAIAGGKAISEVYHRQETVVTIKEDNSPLTQADQKSHEAIMSFLEQTDFPVLSEEGKHLPYEDRKNWDILWVVDPLDGTKEFIKRNGEFTVNIALVKHGAPILGVIFIPETNELYFAAQGLGAYKIEIDANEQTPALANLLTHSARLPLLHARAFTVVGSRSHMSPETEEYIAELKEKHGEVSFLSRGSSLKICMVAEGLADEYPRFAPTMEWDTAAGHAIIKEAGFEMYLHNAEEPLQYNKIDLLNPWFLIKKMV